MINIAASLVNVGQNFDSAPPPDRDAGGEWKLDVGETSAPAHRRGCFMEVRVDSGNQARDAHRWRFHQIAVRGRGSLVQAFACTSCGCHLVTYR